MERKTFNPLEWLDKPEQQTTVIEQTHIEITTSMEEVERIIQYIESNSTDITSAYSDWVNIGFAFADEFGESGRNLFHRISQFYPDYSSQECDKQFDNCLKANGQGVSLKTFFYHAKQAGIPLASPKAEPQIRKHTNSSVGREPSNDQITEVKNEPEHFLNFLSFCKRWYRSPVLTRKEIYYYLDHLQRSVHVCQKYQGSMMEKEFTPISFYSLPPTQGKVVWYIAGNWSILFTKSFGNKPKSTSSTMN